VDKEMRKKIYRIEGLTYKQVEEIIKRCHKKKIWTSIGFGYLDIELNWMQKISFKKRLKKYPNTLLIVYKNN
jgi:hypothetical protein